VVDVTDSAGTKTTLSKALTFTGGEDAPLSSVVVRAVLHARRGGAVAARTDAP
jgi:hypothetical protein